MVTLAISAEHVYLLSSALVITSIITISIVIIIDFFRSRSTKRRRQVRERLLPVVGEYLYNGDNYKFLTTIETFPLKDVAQFAFEVLYQPYHEDHYKLVELFSQTPVYKKFIKQLSNHKKDVRSCAAFMLSMFPNEETAKALKYTMSDNDQTVRVIAASSYIRISKQVNLTDVLQTLKKNGITQRGLFDFFCSLPDKETKKLLAMVKAHESGFILNPELIKDLNNIGQNFLIPLFTLLAENSNIVLRTTYQNMLKRLAEKNGTVYVLHKLACLNWQFNNGYGFIYPRANTKAIVNEQQLQEQEKFINYQS